MLRFSKLISINQINGLKEGKRGGVCVQCKCVGMRVCMHMRMLLCEHVCVCIRKCGFVRVRVRQRVRDETHSAALDGCEDEMHGSVELNTSTLIAVNTPLGTIRVSSFSPKLRTTCDLKRLVGVESGEQRVLEGSVFR